MKMPDVANLERQAKYLLSELKEVKRHRRAELAKRKRHLNAITTPTKLRQEKVERKLTKDTTTLETLYFAVEFAQGLYKVVRHSNQSIKMSKEQATKTAFRLNSNY